MGLFDKLLKGAVDAIDNAAAKNGNGPTGLKDLFNQAMGKKDEAINGTSSTTTSSINDDDYDSGYSDDNTPLFGVVDAPDNKIYELIKKVENGGVPDDALMYLPVNDMGPYVCFKAKVEDRGRATYFYYCPLYEHCDLKCQFGVSYNSDSFGTPLEKKLMAAVDEAVRTMKREVLEVEHRPFR